MHHGAASKQGREAAGEVNIQKICREATLPARLSLSAARFFYKLPPDLPRRKITILVNLTLQLGPRGIPRDWSGERDMLIILKQPGYTREKTPLKVVLSFHGVYIRQIFFFNSGLNPDFSH